jgi:hypothetical protein
MLARVPPLSHRGLPTQCKQGGRRSRCPQEFAVSEVHRRHVLQGLIRRAARVFASRTARAATLLRCDVASPGGQEMLSIYADAIRAMQQMTPDNP